MNQIEIEDVHKWIGELVVENRLLKKQVNMLVAELEALKKGLSENDSPLKEEGKHFSNNG